MTVVDRVLNLPLRAVIALRSSQFLSSETRPDARPVDVHVGNPTLRVLLVGAGLAMGYGVTTQSRALSGQLASALSSRLGRSVSVSVRGGAFLPLERTVDLLEQDGPLRFDLVVFTPGFTELTRGSTFRWRKRLFELGLYLNRTVEGDAPIVFAGLPMPREHGLLERIGRRGTRTTNAVLADVAASFTRISYVPTPSFATLKPTGGSFDERYYVRCAEGIAQAVLPQLADIPSVAVPR